MSKIFFNIRNNFKHIKFNGPEETTATHELVRPIRTFSIFLQKIVSLKLAKGHTPLSLSRGPQTNRTATANQNRLLSPNRMGMPTAHLKFYFNFPIAWLTDLAQQKYVEVQLYWKPSALGWGKQVTFIVPLLACRVSQNHR